MTKYNEPLVSIITANYNGEQFISETIDSVFDQSYQNWELIVIDDYSSDTSVEIIKEYIKKDDRIQLISNKVNLGAAKTRNKGIEAAKGKYIAFLDGDDLWRPEKLNKQISFMLENEKERLFSYTSYQWMDEQGKQLEHSLHALPEINYHDMLDKNRIGCLTAVYNQEVLGKVYMPDIRKRQDYGLWLKLLKRTEFCFGMEEVLADYRVREASMSSNKFEMLKWNWKLFYEIENLGFFKSSFILLKNIAYRIRKR